MENTWTSPVTDRGQSDVDYIKSLSDKIISFGFTSLSEEEQYFWWHGENSELVDLNSQLLFDNNDLQLIVGNGTIKGAFNITDLNRIENNCTYLNELFLERGYSCSYVPKVNEWIESNFIVMSELDRIKQNVIWLSNILSVSYNITLGTDYFNYVNANNIELALYTTNLLLERMLAYFRKSGTFKSGQGVILP